MKLYMPKILYPAFDLPLDADLVLEIDYTKHQEFVEKLVGKGWVVVE